MWEEVLATKMGSCWFHSLYRLKSHSQGQWTRITWSSIEVRAGHVPSACIGPGPGELLACAAQLASHCTVVGCRCPWKKAWLLPLVRGFLCHPVFPDLGVCPRIPCTWCPIGAALRLLAQEGGFVVGIQKLSQLSSLSLRSFFRTRAILSVPSSMGAP